MSEKNRNRFLCTVLSVLLALDIGVHVVSISSFETITLLLEETKTESDILEDYPEWGINESGQTYGPHIYDNPPDLISAVGKDGMKGYLYSSELFGHSPSSDPLLLYASDGKTVLGTFQK